MKQKLKKYAPLAIILLLFMSIWGSGILDFLTLKSIKDHRLELLQLVEDNPIMSALIFSFAYIITVALSLPIASLLTLLGGFLFGVVVGATLIVFSASIGALIIFLVAKTAVGESLRKKAGPFYNKVADNMQENGVQYMLFIRLVPVVPFFIANILPALFNIKLRDFVLTTFFGIIPGTVVYTNIGRELGTIETVSDLIAPQTLMAFVLLGVLSLTPSIIKFFKKKKDVS